MAVSKFMFVNIMDKIKGTRYRSSDELVNKLKDKFIGQDWYENYAKTKIR